jgi:ABC-2 type transport system permease protein
MVYDREMGNMRTLLVSPMPRWFLLSSKLVAGMAVSLPQVYTFLAIAWLWEIEAPPLGYIAVLPALVLSGLMLGALGMLMSSVSKQLENFAGAMNFVIFPMFFASSALYPLWRVREASPLLYYVCELNPFTHAVELVRFALYCQINWISLAVVEDAQLCSWSARSSRTIRREDFLRVAESLEAAHDTLARRYVRRH